jgi:N-acetyl-anhydromuramyl-L-alanine amidase AmpD
MNIRPLHTPLPSRQRDNKPILVVLHATAGATARSSIAHLHGVGLSYHYIITRDARDSANALHVEDTEPIIHHCVQNANRAFHVGSTIPAPDGHGINKASIGISLANIQRRVNPESYPSRQLQAMDELLEDLRRQVPSLKFLTTHAAVQPWNRADPLNVMGQILAQRHNYEWWEPTKQQIQQHRPRN